MKPSTKTLPNGGKLVYRTPSLVRATHWLIAVSLFVLFLSGLQILNAHPALYWGNASKFDQPFLSFGVAGQAFPSWITLPAEQDLAGGRRWHFFFAWCLVAGLGVYFVANLIRGRMGRDLLPTGNELREIGCSVLDHLRLRFPHGEKARHYNVLQKIAYLGVMFVLIPLVILTGLALSPAIDTAFPPLLFIFGGRQSARSLHFFGTTILFLFFVVHILMVVAAGPINEMRSIITGWFAIRAAPDTKSTNVKQVHDSD
jgi:thiosulfate reductase cytochrome b subunit